VWVKGSCAERRGVEECREGERGERKRINYYHTFLFFYFFIFIFIFSNHMFIVSTVQEMTCIFNHMAKIKPKIKLTINKRNKHNQFLQRNQ